MGMKDLDRDAANRSIDYNDAMQRQKDADFSGWDNIKYPLWIISGASLLVVGVVTAAVSLWGSL
jgi:hypothetical protein